MLVEDVLDVGDRDVLSAADDHVLRTAGDVEVAVLVDDGEVTGVEPVPVETRLGHLQPLGVADEQEGPAHLEFPLATGRLHMSTELRTFVFVGILGGFTTFSSFMLDTFTLGHGGDHALAFWNVAAQTAFGLAAVWAGYRVGVALG